MPKLGPDHFPFRVPTASMRPSLPPCRRRLVSAIHLHKPFPRLELELERLLRDRVRTAAPPSCVPRHHFPDSSRYVLRT
ncbi:hypothetical protein B0H12DRAFT_1128901 [Mycena haematopus]|nr:hypothetical protein B0H12DRAFT_1128901 [Mycena haematopus]